MGNGSRWSEQPRWPKDGPGLSFRSVKLGARGFSPGLAALAAAWITLACGSSSDSEPNGVDRVCDPGATQECTGPAGCRGGQQCRDDGSGWSGCDCGGGASGAGGSGGAPVDGGTSGSGTGTGGASAGGTGGSSGTGVGATAGTGVCSAGEYAARPVDVDVLLLLDRSASMGVEAGGGMSVWTTVRASIEAFVGAPESAGLGVGLIAFGPELADTCTGTFPPCPPRCIRFGNFCIPDQLGCDPSDYLPAAAPLAKLPGGSANVLAVLAATTPGGGTPTEPAMRAAMQAAIGHAAASSDRDVFVVLVTDGTPNDCNSTIATVAAAAATGATASTPVLTRVFGIGLIAELDTIAMAGGTGKATMSDPATAGDALRTVLEEFPARLGCRFSLDATHPDGTPVDIALVNLQIGATTIGMVGDALACGPEGGWYYDHPSAPRRIIGCPVTCGAMRSGEAISIVHGCQTVTR